MIRVRLVKTRSPEFLPVGTLGTKIDKGGIEDGRLAPGMHRIQWDWKPTLLMYSSEIEMI